MGRAHGAEHALGWRRMGPRREPPALPWFQRDFSVPPLRALSPLRLPAALTLNPSFFLPIPALVPALVPALIPPPRLDLPALLPFAQWNNGTLSFANPLPVGAIAVSMKVQVYGSWSCDPTLSSSMFGVSLNGVTHYVIENAATTTNCRCDTCDPSVTLTADYRNGLPGYLGTTNRLQINAYRNSLCVNRVEVTIGYNAATTTELPYVFQQVPFNPNPEGTAACATCNSGQKGESTWCSNSTSTTLTVQFTDPVPSGAILVALDLHASYNFATRSYTSSYYSRLGFALDGTLTNEVTLPDVGWRGSKCGCYGNIIMQSALYQRGWPNYVYGGANSLRITVTRTYSAAYGDVCLGRLWASYVYYFIEDADKVLHRIEPQRPLTILA